MVIVVNYFIFFVIPKGCAHFGFSVDGESGGPGRGWGGGGLGVVQLRL